MKLLKISSLLLLTAGLGICTYFYSKEVTLCDLPRSLKPFFSNLGKPIKTVDRVVTSAFLLNEDDEAELGLYFKDRFKKQYSLESRNLSLEEKEEKQKTLDYLNRLAGLASSKTSKNFEYIVFLEESQFVNAAAYPGGVITVTEGMVSLIKEEDELVAILCHEIGHIERGHTLDAYREIMSQNKIKEHYADFTNHHNDLLRVFFSKCQEEEADEYALRQLIQLNYDPFALSRSFSRLLDESSDESHRFITDFLATHPDLRWRAKNAYNQAVLWKNRK